MLYSEIIAVCSEIHTKHINTLCGQNVELLNVTLAVHIVTTGLYRVKELCVTPAQYFDDLKCAVPGAVSRPTNMASCPPDHVTAFTCVWTRSRQRCVTSATTTKPPRCHLSSKGAGVVPGKFALSGWYVRRVR